MPGLSKMLHDALCVSIEQFYSQIRKKNDEGRLLTMWLYITGGLAVLCMTTLLSGAASQQR
jgi:hypothetical protein